MVIRNPIRKTYKPMFNGKTDEWVLQIPRKNVIDRDEYYEVRLPLYLTRTYLSLGGAILRPKRRKYRTWLLEEVQGGKCAECHRGDDPTRGSWTLDHRPPLNQPRSKFIDYKLKTKNRVIHQKCDKAQVSKTVGKSRSH
jgi:hypothetical protein